MADEGYEDLVAFLRSCPAGEEMVFADDGRMPVADVHAHWVDAYIPEACEVLGLNLVLDPCGPR